MPKTHPEKYSEEEWASICGRFSNSILNETEIAKLGQNAGVSWPFKGTGETPNKYIQYSFDELNSVPGLIGKRSRIHKLVDILRETLAFDDPFGDMADKVEAESEVDETYDKILGRINVPTDYPAKFVHFSEETIELLAPVKPKTLKDIIRFGQTLDQSVDHGGDLRAFLNSLAHKDDPGIRKHIPYRRGDQGLHLAEAIGLIAEDLDEALQVELLFQSGAILSDYELELREREQGNHSESQLKGALEKVTDVCGWFVVEARDLKDIFSSGGRPERFFLINDAPRTERVALALARLHFGIRKSSSAKADSGIIGKLASIFGR